MAIERLSGGLTPADGSDPRTFPTIFNAAADYVENGFRFAGTRYFTSSGTFAKANPLGTGDIGLRAVRVRAVGGGGGGGGCAATAAGQLAGGGAGAGGEYAEVFLLATFASSITVTVGAAGTGGAAGNNAGTAGGTSSFGTIEAAGGASGSGQGALTISSRHGANSGTSGTGGTGGTDLRVPGGGGISSVLFQETVMSATGGNSALGAATRPTRTATGTNGNAANVYGVGGGGGANASDQATARTGGNGSAGIVIVELYV
jgi:hypothetical protein